VRNDSDWGTETWVKLLNRKPARRGPQIRDEGNGRMRSPTPQPEQHEPTVPGPGLTDLSFSDYKATVIRAGKKALQDQITDMAAALAYYTFLAIPSILLVALGVFSAFAGPSAVQTLIDKVGTVAPADATRLLDESLTRMSQNDSGGWAMAAVGFVIALWTTTGAMTALMRALNRAYDRDETRGFLHQRGSAVVMVVVMLIAFALVFGLLVMGPALSGWLGNAVGMQAVLKWLWWVAQWPVLIVGLLAAFATVLYLGPNVDHPRWRFITPGSVFAVIAWLAVSGLFAVYTATFASYNKTWGSLAAVIVMLTWLWLSGCALLLGAEINAEAERSRELRQGQEAAAHEIQAPAKA
jgi:membrane protein